ncbi:hypothetical protein [Planctomyces sp. SH-PL62]|uniref:hypothetical protein n=1 Tax=Planctomyces sp. SH-PL62 TaxID=1636152 RepID=UPI00078B1BC1|nr:hypothetical protein [Planctomyces sp. SH-PL62]AMV37743.1 hypothetical protein VT85_09925 [Planctomyces sp. SH-PL62]
MNMRKLTRTWALLAALALAGCGAPPQMGADAETFKTVDALYTAVSLHKPELVDGCLATLKSQREAGKLDQAPYDALEAITTEAKSGSWESAQTRLAQFMRGQRRGR